jgi:serine protease AprX
MANPFRNVRWEIWPLVAGICLTMSVPARAQDSGPAYYRKFDAAIREAVVTGKSVRAIVRFNDETARLRGVDTIARTGGLIQRQLNDIRAFNTVVDAATADALARDAGVAAISLDADVRSSFTPDQLTSVRASGEQQARQIYGRSGRGVTVAIIDSGVQPHVDLPATRIRKFVDFVNGRTTPYDDFGHGTHVAGIIAGSGAGSLGLPKSFAGTAPGADIVALKVLDANGAGTTSDVIAALEWVSANHVAYNIRVVNISLGHPVYEPAATDPLVQAAEALVRRGITVVASAGNLGIDPRDNVPGYGGVTSPANGPSIIAVGAVDDRRTELRSDDTVATYSSRGPTRFDLRVKPDIVAPGQFIVSLAAPRGKIYKTNPALRVPGKTTKATYIKLSGTSMAAPVVAGTAALMLEANPALSASTIRALLEFTAQHLPQTDLMTQGAGYVNALGATRLAALIKPRVGRGKVWLRTQRSVPVSHDTLFGETVAWTKDIIWGDHVILGDSAYVHFAAWDDNIVWGQFENIVWGQGTQTWNQGTVAWGSCSGDGCQNIVWGSDDNIVWGQDDLDNIVWGQCDTSECDNIVWGQNDDNIVWGQDNIVWGLNSRALRYWADNPVWGFWSDAVDWRTVSQQNADNIVWGQDYLDNIVWGQDDNIVWGQNLRILTKGSW